VEADAVGHPRAVVVHLEDAPAQYNTQARLSNSGQ
jgi:hypothetical protein